MSEKPIFHFWRDSNGNEVDLIADVGAKLMPIEIKSGQTINRDFFTGLTRWMKIAGEQAISPSLVYGGTEQRQHQDVHIFGWKAASRIFAKGS